MQMPAARFNPHHRRRAEAPHLPTAATRSALEDRSAKCRSGTPDIARSILRHGVTAA